MYGMLEFKDVIYSQRTPYSKIKSNDNRNIPDKIGRFFKGEIENSMFEKEQNLLNIIIPENITKYLLCRSNLTKVIIPEGTTQIGDGAFGMCMFLEHVILPNSIKYIGKHAFGSIGSLKTITWNSKTYYKNSDQNNNFQVLFNELQSLNIISKNISIREIFY